MIGNEYRCLLDAFANLKKITDLMDGKDFPSYWTLVRKSEYPLIHGRYALYKKSISNVDR